MTKNDSAQLKRVWNHKSILLPHLLGPQPLFNRTFLWRCLCCHCPFDISVGVGAFVIGLSQISSFLSLFSYIYGFWLNRMPMRIMIGMFQVYFPLDADKFYQRCIDKLIYWKTLFVVPAYSRPELYISLWSQKTYKYHICDHSCLNYHL